MGLKSDPISRPAAELVVTGLFKIGLAIKSRSWSRSGLYGLNPTQAQILIYLNTRYQPAIGLSQIANALAVTPATASDSVSALVRKLLVTKRDNALDGRAIALELSDRGRQMVEKISDWTDFLASAVEVLDRDEHRVFVKGLTKIIRTLQQRGEIPVSRMCVTCSYFSPNAHHDRASPHHCNFIDAPFGDQELRLECADHEAADDEMQIATWSKFLNLNGGQHNDKNNQPNQNGGNK